MPEYVTAQRKLTFKTGLPLGRHATFTNDGELWIAVPVTKYRAIHAVTDRLIGALDNIRGQATRWIANNPGDADRTLMLLAVIANADEAAQSAAVDKGEARTA